MEQVFEVAEVVVVAAVVVEVFSNNEITCTLTTTIITVGIDHLMASALSVLLLDIELKTVLSIEISLSKVSSLQMRRSEQWIRLMISFMKKI